MKPKYTTYSEIRRTFAPKYYNFFKLQIKNIVSSVPVQPAVDCVKAVGNYGVQTVSNLCTQFQNETQNTQENETIPETES